MKPADAEAELQELKEYLGDAYDQSRLERHHDEVDAELEKAGSEDRLYRTSEAYLYDLTVFAMSATKDPYLRDLTDLLPAGSRVLDYGCGIGSDGLRLIEAGYEVAFADFDNPSVEYLRWRLRRRGIDAQIFDLDQDQPAGFDLAYAFDVIEHVDEPFDFLARMEQAADRVLVNFLETDENETPLHRRLPVRRLVWYASKRTLLRYRVYHQRSHLVLYGIKRTRGIERSRSWRELVRGYGSR